MAGFALPKLRWLIVGAVAAGVWAVKHDPINGERHVTSQPSRSSAQRKGESTSQNLVKPASPQHVKLPTPRPPNIVTISINSAETPAFPVFYTTSRVRLRSQAAANAPIAGTLEEGNAVTVLEQAGKWRRITAAGRKGWVHGDYLDRTDPRAPRPKQVVAKTTKGTTNVAGFPSWIARSRMSPVSRRPARPPQQGDCQCPYDLMIDGKQCGDRSAYVMRAAKPRCYL